MNPQNRKTNYDVSTINQQYLNDLDMIIKNNELTTKEMNVSFNTGQNLTQNQDNRSDYEKLMDIINLRAKLFQLMTKITDAETSQEILTDLTDDDVIFVYTNATYIFDELAKRFGTFTTKPIFMNFIKTYENQLSKTKGSLGDLDIESKLKLITISQQDIDRLLNLYFEESRKPQQNRTIQDIGMLDDYIRMLNDFSTIILTPEIVEDIKNLSIPEQSELLSKIDFIVRRMPSANELKMITSKLEKAFLQKDVSQVERLSNDILKFIGDIELFQLVENVNNSIKGVRKKQTEEEFLREAKMEEQISKDVRYDKNTERKNEMFRRLFQVFYSQQDPQIQDAIRTEVMALGKSYPLRNYKSLSLNNYFEIISRIPELENYINEDPTLAFDSKGRDKAVLELLQERGIIEDVPPPVRGFGIGQQYSKFGKYNINLKKLYGKGILSLKSQNGNPITGIPSMALSSNSKYIIDKHLNGQKINKKDIEKLTEDEKNILNHIIYKAGLSQHINIPSTKRNQEEQEINRFTILKGQIIAGNDNNELIKEFKTLLLKLSNKGLIPKGEARELMLDLLAMGY